MLFGFLFRNLERIVHEIECEAEKRVEICEQLLGLKLFLFLATLLSAVGDKN
jgi:hypothetical protein